MATSSLVPGAGADAEIAGPFVSRAAGESEIVRRWQAAESRVYPLITVDAGLYEAAVALVCEAADVLRERCHDVASLSSANAVDVLARCPSASTVAGLGLDTGTAFDAACAHRWRELTTRQSDTDSAATSGATA